MRKEFQILDEFIREKGLRHTLQREKILDIFLATERHVSAEELYKLVKKRFHGIGYTTVYRTMKLLSECGLCGETDFGDGILRFEHKYGHEHHDHLICTKCGRFIEVMKPEIEKLQDTLAKQHSFTPTKHKLEIFGICRKCGK
ncbi:MAG: transcriptional repressor [Candidatus Omnitrophica bacterium]|nr:transcriptional repressor [Candidatus Omnitrophota bacterium]